MTAFLALAPTAIVLVGVLGFRWSGLISAAAAAAMALAIWLAGTFLPAAPDQFARALADASVMTLLVASMTLPGLLFVEATRSAKSPEAIGAVLEALKLSPARAAILVAVGVGVLVESLTGMGVSLLVTVPLLVQRYPRGIAIGLGLVGMSLMPWGALSISAHVAAGFAGLDVESLAPVIAKVSGPVAALLPLLAVRIAGSRSRADALIAIVVGLAFWLAIAAGSTVIGVEVAGVVGGLAVILIMTLFAESRIGLAARLAAPGLRPYLWLIACVFAQKLIVGAVAKTGIAPQITTGRVSFFVLTSPGVALLAATLIAASSGVNGAALRTVATRGWRPIASIGLFMIAARLLIESGAVATLAGLVDGLGGPGAVVAVALLGAAGGFATGSGVSGNALFMPGAAAVGQNLGQLPLFAALQNGATGHVAMASLPVAALFLAALPNRTREDDAAVMRQGLALSALYVAVLIMVGLISLR